MVSFGYLMVVNLPLFPALFSVDAPYLTGRLCFLNALLADYRLEPSISILLVYYEFLLCFFIDVSA